MKEEQNASQAQRRLSKVVEANIFLGELAGVDGVTLRNRK